jgi:hypothetical protein
VDTFRSDLEALHAGTQRGRGLIDATDAEASSS